MERDQVIFVLLHRFDLEMLSVDITPILEHYSSKEISPLILLELSGNQGKKGVDNPKFYLFDQDVDINIWKPPIHLEAYYGFFGFKKSNLKVLCPHACIHINIKTLNKL